VTVPILTVVTALREVAASRELLWNLTLRELRGRYKRSALGWTWSLVNPLVTMALFTVVFGVFLRARPAVGDPSGLDVFALWLLCALLPWTFLAGTLSGGALALVGNANLVKKVYFPRETLVGAVSAANLATLLTELGVLLVALTIAGSTVLPWLPGVLVVTALLVVFGTGLALALAVLNVYFRDTQHFLSIALQVWFYASPIVYPQSYVRGHLPPAVLAGYEANPMTLFASAYRALLYDLRWPPLGTLAALTGWAAGALVLGWLVFGRLSRRLAEEL
jgi:ABC-type polysaccharide/polyol phosphate export permease